MNRDDVIDVLSVVAAATRRTVGEMDVQIWGAVIGDLDKHQAIKAVEDHLREKPGVWLEPGHIAERVKACRREAADKAHTQRVLDEGHAARMLAIEQANRDRIEELAETVGEGIPWPTRTRRTTDPALTVPCPWEPCRAKPGQPCINSATGSKPRHDPHPSRTEAAALTKEADDQ